MTSRQPDRSRAEVVWIAVDPGIEGCPPCPACAGPLDLHQPDLEAPGRLLATCGCCGRWHLIKFDASPEGATMILTLPEVAPSPRRARGKAVTDDLP